MPNLLTRWLTTETRRYVALGAAFGLVFPLIATLVTLILRQLPISVSNMWAVQTTDPLLWIIDTAPFFLGAFSGLAGRRQDALQSTNQRLREATHALEKQEQRQADELGRQAAQLKASADVSRAAASTLDREELLTKITELIVERFGFYYAAVFLLDASGENVVLHKATGEAGRILKERGHKLPVDNASMVGSAITTRKPRIALDVGKERVRFANPLLPNTRSEIALPLVVGDHALGALDVQSIQEAAFDDANAAVLQSMADLIAVALNTATSFSQARTETQRAKQIATLLGSTLELTLHSDRQTVYDRIVRIGMDLVNADGAGLALPISDTELEMKTSIEVGSDPQQMTGRRLKINESISGRVFATKQTLRIDNYPTWSGRSQAFTDAPSQAILGVPLVWQDRVLAVLTITHSQPNQPFTEDDEFSIKLLAAQGAATLANVDLRENQAQTLNELNALNLRLTRETWTAFSKQLKREGVDWIGMGEPIGPDRQPEVSEALSSGRIATNSESDQNQTAVAIPIVLRGVPIGVMRLRVPSENWSSSTASTLTSIAGHIAQAIENARLLQVTEERFARERDLSESTDKIRRKTDVEQILQTAAEELARHLQATRVAVSIGPQPSAESDRL
ncbi:MAG TPA: GAF domain-containing protein [Anaerolineae bacterium]|nr:GAF domain-containing protein [Anaerolineae bacterium]